MNISPEWVKTTLLIAVTRKDEPHSSGALYTFYKDESGAYFQDPEYVDCIIRSLGLGQYNIVQYGGVLQPIVFVSVMIDGQDWTVLDPR